MFNKNMRIETERLLIRPFITEDRDSIYNIMKDEKMYEYTPDEPWKSFEDADGFIKLTSWLYDLNHKNFRHFFAITEKQNETMIGFCGVGGIAYDRSENEIFYSIGCKYWGQGYATEAAKAMLRYAFDTLELSKVIGVVHPKNIASNRIMDKIGLKKTGVLSRLPEEFQFFNGEYVYLLNREEYLNIE
jgi:ribosomal-protein-alanine N-acetyltransferase